MNVVKFLAELRKQKIDIVPAHCVLAVQMLGGRASKAQLVKALGYENNSALNLARVCQQGYLDSAPTEETAAEGGAHYREYFLTEKGAQLYERLEAFLKED